jgi:hypothetical protein
MKKLSITLMLALGVLATTAAFAAESMPGYLGIQITNGEADLYSSSGNYISAYTHPEVGVGVSYWRLMNKDYAFAFNAGIGTFSETDKSAVSTDTDFKYSQSSWNVRIGGDRAVKVGDRAILYFGPGLEFWSGKAKFEGGTFTSALETSNVTRIALSGRVGGVMMLSQSVGFNCQVGRYVGMASAKDDVSGSSSKGAKATWWPSGFQASGGIIFKI